MLVRPSLALPLGTSDLKMKEGKLSCKPHRAFHSHHDIYNHLSADPNIRFEVEERKVDDQEDTLSFLIKNPLLRSRVENKHGHHYSGTKDVDN